MKSAPMNTPESSADVDHRILNQIYLEAERLEDYASKVFVAYEERLTELIGVFDSCDEDSLKPPTSCRADHILNMINSTRRYLVRLEERLANL